jgi:pilus assembly protein FimV
LPAKLPKVRPPTLADETATGAEVVAPLPMATELSMLATAFGPIATLFWPVAWLSASVELAWKYLMPFSLMLSIAAPTLLLVVVVPSVL